jgi:hypothetical protein
VWQALHLGKPGLQLEYLSTFLRPLQLHSRASWRSIFLVDCVARSASEFKLAATLAIVIEAGWEVLENTNFVIERYRTATAAVGYSGDTVVNSLGDIICCILGFISLAASASVAR